MFVDMVTVRVVQMTVVQVVNMAIVQNGGVAAVGAMLMVVISVVSGGTCRHGVDAFSKG